MNTKNLLELAKYNTIEYGSYTIMNRAIPDFRDGLKPVHRRILWAMYVGNYHSNGNFKKSANVIGDTMGKYHPHGDCLRGNTKIYLLDGSVRTIQDIVESGSQSLSILSYDVENKKFIPAQAHSWRIGQETSIMYRIHLSENNDIIECTGNHQFLTLNGKWVSADRLKDFDLLFGGNLKRVNYVCAKRIEKINLNKEEKFYDFTVDNYHNLVMLTSNNNVVVTHNSGIYSSLVTLVNSPEPPIQGQGQWGSFRDPSRAAAPRYTEVRLSKYGEKFLLDPIYIKSAVMVDNYSGEHKEPLYLPAKVPNILINGSEGIATACSNLIPSFSLDSVKELIRKKLNSEMSIKDVATILKFKFTYGGKFIGNNLIDYLKTGKASLYFIPEFEINLEENLISLVSASPRFNLEKFMTKVSELKDIKSVDDLSAGDSINISIYTKNIDKRNKKEVIVKIKELATTSLPCNTLITRRSEESTAFRKVSIVKLVDLWLEWRKSFEKKVVKRLLQEEDAKLKSQELIKLAIENRQVIKDSMEVKEPEKYVSSKLKITLEDSNKILAFPIRKLAKVEIGKIDSAIEKINSDINSLKTTKIEKRVERSL